MNENHQEKLTLKDKLSHLSYNQVCRLLGNQGKDLIHRGGKIEINIDQQVRNEDDFFSVTFGEAKTIIRANPQRKNKIDFECSACEGQCEHLGATFALILEEKTSLGLAKPPVPRIPVESLSEQDLVARELQERMERAQKERMALKTLDSESVWTDYLLTNRMSGKTYRVALRGLSLGESYCSCPDFRKNTLGTCKHILYAQGKIKKRFTADQIRKPYKRKDFSLHINYGKSPELRLLVPENVSQKIHEIISPVHNKPITDLRKLFGIINRLEGEGFLVNIYPDAEAKIQKTISLEKLRKISLEIRKNPKSHSLRNSLLKAELLPYQLDGIGFAVGAGRAVLADDMGLGKTIQGIGVAELLARKVGIKKVLVVCPTSLKSQWSEEIRRFSDRDVQLVLGAKAERMNQYNSSRFFTVCNYEQVLRDIIEIEQTPWDLIILDEGQRIKNWEAQTSQTIKSLKSPYALVLSGTPLENRLDELYSVVEFVDEHLLGPAFQFSNRHKIVDEKGRPLGYKNLDELRKNLKPILLRRTRQSVMQDLPQRTTEFVRIIPTAEQLELDQQYKKLISLIIHKPYISEMDLLRLQKYLLMCRMSADSTYLVNKQEPGYSSKLEELDRLLGNLLEEQDRKIVLFSEWTTMLDLIEPLIEKNGVKFVRLDGSVPQKKRQGLVNEFQNNPDCRLFIATNAGSTGLNLQSANTLINVDLPWNPAVLEQRIARIHRMGQKRPIQVYILVTTETLEENLLQTIAAKHELALAALDPESDVTQVELSSSMEELKKRLEILVGKKPTAPLDASQERQTISEAELVKKRETVAKAGGELLSAAFSFMGEILSSKEARSVANSENQKIARVFRQNLSDCMTRDSDGQLKLTVTLPDESVLNNLAGSLARIYQIGNMN